MVDACKRRLLKRVIVQRISWINITRKTISEKKVEYVIQYVNIQVNSACVKSAVDGLLCKYSLYKFFFFFRKMKVNAPPSHCILDQWTLRYV